MANSVKHSDLLEIYKIARKSVEHFDKLLANFRQIMFAFNGIFISSGISFFLSSELTKDIRYIKFSLISLFWGFVNIILWLLEKHYHRYLIVSASVAKGIEEELFGKDMKKCLTYQMECIRGHNIKLWALLIRSYDLIYILPIVVSIIFNLYLAKESWGVAGVQWVSGVNSIFTVIVIILAIAIIKQNNRYEESFQLKNL